MKATIDDLLNDINKSERTEIIIKIHTGSEVIIKPYRYNKLRLSKDAQGAIGLGNYDSNEGYIITDEHHIVKTDNMPGRISYKISKDDIPLVNVIIS